ncbi:MAG: DNA recombination/repair protein RecA, partial [Candidatus Komeilibacteria bacterium]|nr:DNA recombination/repair protein RecA [Candidatus Komeilibacteria bacterium]
KVAAPFQTCEFDIMYNEGISRSGDLIDIGSELGVITKSGNSYSFGEERMGVGRENARMYLATNIELMEKIRQEAWDKFKKDRMAA